MTTRRFGPYEVIRFVDGVYKAPVDHLTHLRHPEKAQSARREWGSATIDVPVNMFALADGEGVTLIDAGAGAAWGAAYGHARDAMKAQGVAPRDVGKVLLTHLHGDHALGLLEGEAPYFPRAEILVPASELAFYTDPGAKERTAPERRGAFDVAARVAAAYGRRLTPLAAGLTPIADVATIPLPGHTPGHVGYLIGEGEGALLLFGDALHVAALQAGDPDLGFIYDVDPAQAARSRRAALDQAATRGLIVSGGHIEGFARVLREGAGWRFEAA